MITIFGTKNCNHCDLSKKVCELRGLEYEYVALFEEGNEEATAQFVQMGYKTVPQIFVEGKHIGGYTELCNHVAKR